MKLTSFGGKPAWIGESFGSFEGQPVLAVLVADKGAAVLRDLTTRGADVAAVPMSGLVVSLK